MERSKHAMSSEQASLVKKAGHQREEVFNSYFGGKGFAVNYSGASPDNIISKENPICEELIKKGLIKKSGDVSVSLKSGNTIQIHLGRLCKFEDLRINMEYRQCLSIKICYITPSKSKKSN